MTNKYDRIFWVLVSIIIYFIWFSFGVIVGGIIEHTPKTATGSVRVDPPAATIYKGDHPPSDTDKLWCDTLNQKHDRCDLRYYKNGKWEKVLGETKYVEDYK